MGEYRYRIPLRLFNSISHGWVKRTSEIKLNKKREILYLQGNHVLFCLFDINMLQRTFFFIWRFSEDFWPLNKDYEGLPRKVQSGRWIKVFITVYSWQFFRDFGRWPPNKGWPLNRGLHTYIHTYIHTLLTFPLEGSLIEVRLYIRFVFRLFSRTLFGRKDTTISSLPMALHLNTMPLTHMSDKLVLKCWWIFCC